MIYKLLSKEDEDLKRVNMTRWEAELGQTFTLTEWLHASQSTSKLSRCINHKEIMCKIHLRWYMTPTRFHHIKPDASSLCWRQCGALGTHLHMWWHCPVTSAFWIKVTQLLAEVLNYNVILTPELAVLDIHLKTYPTPLRTIMQHVLVSARYVIAQHWNSADPLNISEVIGRTNFHCHCETKLVSTPLRCKSLYSLWEPWMLSKYYK